MPRGNVRVSIQADVKDLKRGVDDANRSLGKFGDVAKATAAAAAGAFSATVIVDFARQSVGAASAVNESLTKNQVLFKKYAADVESFSDRSAKAFGISKQAALEYTGVFGNLFNALGVSDKKSATLSVSLTKLAADLASFNNTSIDDALEALRSGLVGETEPLRKFGVNLNDATLRVEAMNLGLTKSTKNVLTPYQRSMAAVALITKQTDAAHGDFKRTSGGLANQQRILSARIQDLKVKIGTALLPTVLDAVTAINKFATSMQGGTRNSRRFSAAVAEISSGLRDVTRAGKDAYRVLAPIFGPVLKRFGEAAAAAGKVFAGFGRTISRVVHGDISGAFKEFKSLVGDVFKYLLKFINLVTSPLRTIAKAVGKVAGGIADLPGKALKAIGLGDGTGDGIGDGTGYSGSLMGASPALGSYAGIGSRYGLRVTSGRRPGATTQSGNRSLHADGAAIDMSGSPGSMLRYARYMASEFGPGLNELIHTPLGYGIKNGKRVPLSYWGSKINADHYDHVHVGDSSPGGGRGDGTGRVVVKGRGSWFGGPRDGMDSGKTASGGTTAAPGCAIRPGDHYNSGRPYLGGVWRITAPNGKTANVRQTDIGPNQSTGRRIDITYSALGLFGYNEKNFPTDATFTAVYLGKSAAPTRVPKMKGFAASKVGRAGFGHSFGYFDKMAADRKERATTAMSGFLERVDNSFEAPYQLALTTPGAADDLTAAKAGLRYGERLVASVAQRVRDGRATGADLADAIGYRDTWQARVDTAGGADGAADFAQAQASLAAEMKANRELAERIISTTGGQVIQGLIASMASTGIGTSFNLSNQAAGQGAGLHARY